MDGRTPQELLLVAEYLACLRVPLMGIAALMLLPYLASRKGLNPLLGGLFDLSWQGLFFVTTAAMAAAGTIVTSAGTIYQFASARLDLHTSVPVFQNEIWWIAIGLLLTLPSIGYALVVSIRQQGEAWKLYGSTAAGYTLSVVAALIIQTQHFPNSYGLRLREWMNRTGLFAGYAGNVEMWHSQLRATLAFAVILLFYFAVGYYGHRQLGKRGSVPALCSPLALLMLLCWSLSAATFFLDKWHIPLLIPLIVFGWITSRSSKSDHFYQLVARAADAAPSPGKVVAAKGFDRIIVVAANGGGIQASAWASEVLSSLSKIPGFDSHLCLISSVSGSSVGAVYFVHWLENQKKDPAPVRSASKSSLEAVAWGLAWPDFLRGICPWLLGGLGAIGRGRALEEAWCRIGPHDEDFSEAFGRPLSSWNTPVAKGELPAVVLNATVVESGNRLLLGTTTLEKTCGTGCTQPSALHGSQDISIITAARLSASFPYVTPAARAKTPDPRHHLVDGGYYDNYGMATLVEWVDEALHSPSGQSIKKVLVIQILAAKASPDSDAGPEKTSRGWFYQAGAPIETLMNVRDAGQMAHRDIELRLLQEKWELKKVNIDSVRFEFPGQNPPLSWHLTRTEKKAIKQHWNKNMGQCRDLVHDFLRSSLS